MWILQMEQRMSEGPYMCTYFNSQILKKNNNNSQQEMSVNNL